MRRRAPRPSNQEWLNIHMRYNDLINEDLSPTAIAKTLVIYGDKIRKALDAAKRIPQNSSTFDSIAFTFREPTFEESFLLYLDGVSPDTGYVAWILKCFLAGNFRYMEDIYKVREPLETYTKAKPKLPVERRDINRFRSFNEFMEFIDTIKEDELVSNREAEREEEKRLISSGQAVIFYNDPDVKIVIPNTIEASRWFGKNTRWCTAAKDSSRYFDEYSRDGKLYIILFKKTNTRWQFHFESASFMNELDDDLTEMQVRTVSDLFPDSLWEISIEKDIENIKFVDNPSEKLIRFLRRECYPYGNVTSISDDGKLKIDRSLIDQFTYGLFEVILKKCKINSIADGNSHLNDTTIDKIRLEHFLKLVKQCDEFQTRNQDELKIYYEDHDEEQAGKTFAWERMDDGHSFLKDSGLRTIPSSDPRFASRETLSYEAKQKSDLDVQWFSYNEEISIWFE